MSKCNKVKIDHVILPVIYCSHCFVYYCALVIANETCFVCATDAGGNPNYQNSKII